MAAGAATAVPLSHAEATRALGRALGRTAERGFALALSGPLGAGKTTLAQGFLEGAGVATRATSPAFTLVRIYEGPGLSVAHADLYRLADAPPEEGDWIEETLAAADVRVVEWPERVKGLLPPDHLAVALVRAGAGRRAEVRAHGPRSAGWWERARAALAAEAAHGAERPASGSPRGDGR